MRLSREEQAGEGAAEDHRASAKRSARAQWGHDPAGAIASEDEPLGMRRRRRGLDAEASNCPCGLVHLVVGTSHAKRVRQGQRGSISEVRRLSNVWNPEGSRSPPAENELVRAEPRRQCSQVRAGAGAPAAEPLGIRTSYDVIERPRIRPFGQEELRNELRGTRFQRVPLKRLHVGMGRLTPCMPVPIEGTIGRRVGWYLVHEAR
jgi:hypothetical protein